MRDDIHCAADDDGRNAILFKFSRRQTDGLVTDGSQWYKQRDIYLILDAGLRHGRCVLFCCEPVTVLGWNKMIARCQ